MKTNKLINILALSTAVILTSCSVGLEEETSAGIDASFIASSFSSSAERQIEDHNWGIPTKTKFVAKTCLQDSAYGKSIVGQRFDVTGDNVAVEVTSNERGCIEWNDFVQFDFFSAQRFLKVERTITGLGDYSGELVVKFTFDPWNKEIKNIDNQKAFTSAASLEGGKTLFIENPKLTLRSAGLRNGGAALTGQIALTPKFERFNVAGASVEKGAFKKGNFNVTVFLFEGSEVISVPKTFSIDIDKNGKLVSDISLKMFKLPSQNNEDFLKLGLRISPNETNAPKFLDRADWMVTVDKKSFKVIGSLESSALPSFNIGEVVESASMIQNDESSFGLRLKAPSVQFNGYAGTFVGTSSVKPMRTMIKTCILNAVTKTKVEELPFTVTILDENREVISESNAKVANTDGCITTYFVEEYNLDKKRTTNWIKRYVRVEGLEGAYIDAAQSREFYINPWETNRYSHTILGELPPSYNSVQESKLHTSKFGLKYVGNDSSKFRVNRHLDMSFVKTFKVEFEPKINRGYMHSGEKGYERLYSGNLKVRLMILSPKSETLTGTLKQLLSASSKRVGSLSNETLENYNFITGSTVEVKVIDSKVSAFIDLKFNTNNVKYMSARTYIVAEISPSNPESSLMPMILTIPANLASTRESKDTITTDTLVNVGPKMLEVSSKINTYFAKIEKIKLDSAPVSPYKVSSYDLFEQLLIKSEKLTNVRGIDKISYLRAKKNAFGLEYAPLLTEDDFKTIINMKSNEMDDSISYTSPGDLFFGKNTKMTAIVKKLCGYYYLGVNNKRKLLGNYVSDQDRCMADPYAYLSISGSKFVIDITKQPTHSSGSNQRSISVGINNSSTVSKSFSKSWGWKTSFGMKIPAFGLFSAGVDGSYGESKSNSESLGERISFGESQRLDIEETVLEFEAKTRECVIVKAKGNDIRKGLTKGLRICEKTDKIEVVKEKWFLVNEPWRRRSFISDPGAENAMRIFKLVRGETNYQIFKNKIEASNNDLFMRPTNSRGEVTQYLAGLYESQYGEAPYITDGSFPGMIQ